MRFPSILSNLRIVLIMQVALPVLLALAVILMIGLSMVGQFIEERMQRDLQQVARTIHLPVSQALERQDLEQLQNSMASVFGITEVYGAYLFDVHGKRLSSFGVVNPTQEQATDALEQIVQGEFSQYERIRGRDVYSFFMPLFDATGQPNGLLQVTRRRSDIDQELTELKYWAWGGFSFVSLIILGVIIFSHQRAVETPLQRLVESMRRVSQGDRHHRAAEQGPIEISQLATGLNGMLDAIEQAENSEAKQRSEREKMAERLRQTETMAALGQLSAGVAHELGAPLTVVDGRASRLLRRLDNDMDVKELNEIRQQAARMTSIIQQLLSFGRSSRAEMRELDVTSLIQRSEALLADQGYQIKLIIGPTAKVKGDSLSLEQALINLLRNACQACPEGPVELSWQLDSLLHIHIDDAGLGITEEQKTQVFEPFVTTKAPGEGSGLGLAIVQRIMREHHGEVKLSDSPLGGARFSLILPIVTTQSGNKA